MMKNSDYDRKAIQEAWNYFAERVKTDEDAADIFFRLSNEGGRMCDCAFPDLKREAGSRLYKCPNCKLKKSFTSGTLLAGTTRLRAWAAMIWFKELKIPISACALSRLTGVAQSTGLNIHRKVNMVVESEMGLEAIEIDAEMLSEVIIKRSTTSEALSHPRSEVIADEENDDNDSDDNSDKGESAKKKRRLDFALVSFDVKRLSIQAIEFIRDHFQGVSARCVQLYLAALWCASDSVRWQSGSLLRACMDHPPISYAAVLKYSSGQILRIMPELAEPPAPQIAAACVWLS
jgi:hypothetical protein